MLVAYNEHVHINKASPNFQVERTYVDVLKEHRMIDACVEALGKVDNYATHVPSDGQRNFHAVMLQVFLFLDFMHILL